jgi:myo-inositol-1(or 4)-monophosphatase
MTSADDPSHLTVVAIQAALQAGDIIRKGFGEVQKIKLKPGRQNIVTESDQESEDCIITFIRERFPGHAFLAEERGAVAGAIENDITWIIDPLDGTTNFAHQIPIVTISIAAYRKEVGLSSVILQPFTNELFVAQKGRGAYLNGNRLNVSNTPKVEDALIGAGFPYNINENPIPYMNHFTRLTQQGVTFRHLGSAALSLAYVSAGKLDGFWMDQLHPWDLAAGKLLIEEANGTLTRYSGALHEIDKSCDILATNLFIHEQMILHLK